MEINLKNRTGTINLRSSHSVIIGNRPKTITPERMIEKTARDGFVLEQFGLWDNSMPNYTTYYPDVTPEDLNPKEEDYITPIFRALSKTILWKGYRPIDFSEGNVLKDSMQLLVGQTINVDHEIATGNAIGTVRSVFWQESYTKDGVTVPAGINAEFMIDGKSNPRLARGIQMKPPSIHSNSVSVRFAWKPSHVMKNDEDFMSKLGTMDSKGQLYRLIVTEIIQYTETSLVPHGADAFAQKIGEDGKIVNPIYANSVYNFSLSEDDDKPNKANISHVIDYKNIETFSLSAIPAQPNNTNNNNNNENHLSMEGLLEKLELALGLTKGSLKEESVTSEFQKFIQKKDDTHKIALDALQAKYDELSSTNEKLNSDLTAAQAFKVKADQFDAANALALEELKKTYRLAKGEDGVDEVILAMFDKQGPTEIAALLNTYKKEADEKFKPTCKSCGSTDVSRASSFSEDDDEKGKEKNTGKVKARDNKDVKASFQTKSFKKA